MASSGKKKTGKKPSGLEGAKIGTHEGAEYLTRALTFAVKNGVTEGFRVELDDDNNLYKWHIHLFDFPATCNLADSMEVFNEATGRDTVMLEVLFPEDFPVGPPFIRVVYPRFHQYTGHITIGGSLCVQELTRSGWKSEFDLFTFVIMLRNLLVDGGALIDMDSDAMEYTEAEARASFIRVAEAHGWKP